MQIVILTYEQNIIDICFNVKSKSFVSCMMPLINKILKANSVDLFKIKKNYSRLWSWFLYWY